MPKKRKAGGKLGHKRPDEEHDDLAEDEEQEPILVDLPKQKKSKMVPEQKILYVVLEEARLEIAKMGDIYRLLNSDDHRQFLLKAGKDPAEYRPDITHQSLLNLLDSPLNRNGNLRIIIRTVKNILIEVNPQCRIPRTFPRFAGLMVQLFHKLKIKAADSDMNLLKVIKNPIVDHLPIDGRKILLTKHCDNLLMTNKIPENDDPVVVIIGAMANGSINPDYANEKAAISEYPLSAALACAKVCSGFEEKWGVH